MPYFLIITASEDQGPQHDQLQDFIDSFGLHSNAVSIDRDAALAAGACPWCPEGCRSCTGYRADCECYSHQPDDDEAVTR